MFLGTLGEGKMLTFFIIFLLGYVINSSSFHSLSILLIIELFVLFSLFSIFCAGFSLFTVVFFLVVVVCAGAYGISLLVSSSSLKSGSSFLLF